MGIWAFPSLPIMPACRTFPEQELGFLEVELQQGDSMSDCQGCSVVDFSFLLHKIMIVT